VTSWLDDPMLAWDTETTAADPTTARIVTSTGVRIEGSDTHTRSWLLDPGVEIPAEAAEIHGVTTERAQAEGQDATAGLREIALLVAGALRNGVPVVGHNVVYDLTVLDHDLQRHDLGPLTEWVGGEIRPILDTLCIDRGVDRYRRGKRTLTAACEHYRVKLDGAHDATFDALASARVLWRMAQTYNLAALSLDDLHAQQIEWHTEWATHFQQYLKGKGSDEVISTEWPIRRVAVAA
jgi:DNA polymerase-3 subunit epsilon